MTRIPTHLLPLLCTALIVSACGGGGDSASNGPPGGGTDQQRIQAATTTAQNNELCTAVRPFYWEIGDRSAALASGSVNSGSSTTVYTANSVMSIASASKWLYGSYVAQKRRAALTTEDYKYLNFQSGYTNLTDCLTDQTVAECDAYQGNGDYTAANDGKFFYNGGHMEKHALLMGLGAMNNAALGAEIRSQLGADVAVAYSQPQLAGGAYLTPSAYALVLRKMLTGQLLIGSMLGTHPVCTNPSTCPTAVFAPIPLAEKWHYSIGHWVEDDPDDGDGAFSSAGAFGFYPWIDASKTYYGVVARSAAAGAFDSIYCGRLIRKAWVTGVAQ
ncbi:MAG: hypothetical protein K8R60_12325 [Burkholderiales bacterium]|nr:hypothetical protein [Burkholderiales bacterium]